MALLADLAVVSGSEDSVLRLWDTESGSLTRTLTGHSRDVKFCAFLPDGTGVVSASWDNTLRLWDTASGSLVSTSEELRAALEAVADQRELQQRLHDSAAMRSTQAGQAALMAEAHAQAEQAAIEKLERELQGYRDQLQRYQQEVETQRGLQSKAAAESAEALVRAQAASNQEAVIDREIQTVGKQAAILGTAMATRDLCALTPAVMPLVLAELGLGRLSAGFVAQKMSACAIVESATEELVHLGLHDMMECKYLVNALCTIEACGVLGLSQAAIESHVGSSELTGASLEALGAAMWKAEQVQQWLVSKGIEEGEAAKVSSGIGGEHLLHLDAKDLQSLGVSALGDRKRVAREIKQLRKSHFAVLRSLFFERQGMTGAAAASACKKKRALPEEYKCPITLEVMKEPVVAEDGFIYEGRACHTLRSAIRAFLSVNCSTSLLQALGSPVSMGCCSGSLTSLDLGRIGGPPGGWQGSSASSGTAGCAA
eukprot:m51a1_g13488 hypothetical protein (485) ;mRNA; f:59-2178